MKGFVAVITGGAGHIGRATGRKLASQDMRFDLVLDLLIGRHTDVSIDLYSDCQPFDPPRRELLSPIVAQEALFLLSVVDSRTSRREEL